jgi:hypothetical protein
MVEHRRRRREGVDAGLDIARKIERELEYLDR